MLLIVISLAMLAVFANLQHFHRAEVERVVIRAATSPTPSPQQQ